ncbi:hypothetical protein F5887DRAFT_1075353 [Amanita rubescens]|nr:hypothetical protein F5887DRAFT_1075353 [Amanita rubescens]
MTLHPQSTTNLQPSAMLAANGYYVDPQNPNSQPFPGTFGDGFNPGSVAPAQLGYHTIDPANLGNPPPPPYSTSAGDTTVSFASWPTLQTSMQAVAPMIQNNVEINAVRQAARRRRIRSAAFYCETCGADFTSAHNLQYHLNGHEGLRPHACEHKDRGCDYSAAAPSTATRHSGTCRYKPS